jgi:hypothetical protein
MIVRLLAVLTLGAIAIPVPADAALPDKVQENLWGITEWVYRNTPPEASHNLGVVAPDCHQVCGRLWDAQHALGRSDSEIVRELLTLATESGVWSGFFARTYDPVGPWPYYLGNKIGSGWRDDADPHTWLGVDQPPSTVPVRNVKKGEILTAIYGSGGEQATIHAPTLGWVVQNWSESRSPRCGSGDPTPVPPGPDFHDLEVDSFCYWWKDTTQKWVTEWGGMALHVYFAEMMFDGAPRDTPGTYDEDRNMQALVAPDQGFGVARGRLATQLNGIPGRRARRDRPLWRVEPRRAEPRPHVRGGPRQLRDRQLLRDLYGHARGRSRDRPVAGPELQQPVAQGGSARAGRWWEYDDVAGRRKIVVEHPDRTVHVGTPKAQSAHREGGPPKYYDDGNFGHVGE